MNLRKVAVIGSKQMKFESRAKNVDYREMIYRTTTACLEEHGLTADDIDTLIGAGCDMQDGRSISSVFTVEAMGGFLKEESKVEEDGIFAAMYAYQRLLSGLYDTAMVVAYSKGSELAPTYFTGLMFDPIYSRPVGLDGITAAALQARRYMSVTGACEEHAAMVAVKNRANGKKNPFVDTGRDITVEEVLRSAPLATPVKELDAAPAADGCCVLLLAAEGKAEKMCPKPAWIRGASYINDHYYLGMMDLAGLPGCREAARRAYAAAGVKRPASDIDVAEVYEITSFQEMILCEALGLCDEHDGAKMVASGKSGISGSLPVNPSGGALCADAKMVTGLVRLAEAAAQISGAAGEHQIHGAKTALAHGFNGNALQHNAVFVLGA